MFSVHSASDSPCPAHMNVNLQVVELEQHIILYGMMDIGRGVTKDQRTILPYSGKFSSFVDR